ncbi:MAG: response regulator transcription factor [Alphaproteobacteria bacterium]|nr:response regulator transcription factor [Alphaproteobacteria bacterium]
MFREGVVKTLAVESNFEIVGQGANSDDALQLVHDHLPEIALLDISMPGGGIDTARQIANKFPVVKIVMLTASTQENDVVDALQAGAQGYILKGVGGDELVAIIRSVSRGEAYVAPDLAARLLVDMQQTEPNPKISRDVLSDLTFREEQILKLVSRGLSNKEIGREIDLQEKTVKHYMTNILQKLQVRNRVEAALLACDRLAAE